MLKVKLIIERTFTIAVTPTIQPKQPHPWPPHIAGGVNLDDAWSARLRYSEVPPSDSSVHPYSSCKSPHPTLGLCPLDEAVSIEENSKGESAI